MPGFSSLPKIAIVGVETCGGAIGSLLDHANKWRVTIRSVNQNILKLHTFYSEHACIALVTMRQILSEKILSYADRCRVDLTRRYSKVTIIQIDNAIANDNKNHLIQKYKTRVVVQCTGQQRRWTPDPLQ
jgi:hypothetical protein